MERNIGLDSVIVRNLEPVTVEVAGTAVMMSLLQGKSLAEYGEMKEAGIVAELSTALRAQRDRLQRAVRTSVGLGIAGLVLTALAYVVDKGFYAP